MKRAMLAAFVLAASLPCAAGAETPAEKRLRVLEEALRRTQQEVQELRRQIEQQKAIGQAAEKQAEQAEEEVKTASAEAKKKAWQVPQWLERTALFGDVRLRHEGFYHQPHAAGQKVTARNRERIRARLGLRYTYSDELSATVRAATGNPNDPISTNETLSGDFTRKHINLDWAYLTFTPGKTFGVRPGLVSVTGGKFPNPIFRTDEMVFDDDLAPEGANETFALLAKPVGNLDQLRLHLLEWTFDEVANAQDGWMFGGQLDPVFHFSTTAFEFGVGQYWWLDSDAIAQALNTNSTLFNTNLLTTATDSKGKKTITGYRSSFNQTNATAALTFPNVIGARPLRAFADYVYNWEAATDEARGWTAGLKLGETRVRGDWALTGYYEQLEREAAISSFAFSDFGNGGTNVEGPVASVDYQLLNPLTLTARGYFTNALDRSPGMTNPTQTRIQLDAMVKW